MNNTFQSLQWPNFRWPFSEELEVWSDKKRISFTILHISMLISPGKVKHWEKSCVTLHWAGIAGMSGCRLLAGRGSCWCSAPSLAVWSSQYYGNGPLSITAFWKAFSSSRSRVLLAFVLLILCFLTTCCWCHGKLLYWMQVQGVGTKPQCFILPS